ncbi:ATP-binding protein [Kineococcus glutinatus]|uniref:Histidine kinase/HSP90-like ATPase domain-containing protein n=1 Tax=Kineococcus glutinatus TaxID=1070872 RepID=A0ABP9HXM0_9ACTN
MGEVVSEPLSLDPVAQAVSAARRYVRAALDGIDAGALEECAELGVSELVTNAVLHGRTALTVTVRRMPSGRVRIEVSDNSPVPPRQRRFDLAATTGRGLRLVDSASHDWGIEPFPPERGRGKTVWFEPREDPTAAGFPDLAGLEDLDVSALR